MSLIIRIDFTVGCYKILTTYNYLVVENEQIKQFLITFFSIVLHIVLFSTHQ